MKNSNKSKNVICELANEFISEFDAALPITILPNGDVVYKDYLIKQNKNKNWEVYDYKYKVFINDFFLKTCALLAAKEYSVCHFADYQQIRHLDKKYQSHYCDIIVYRHTVKQINDDDSKDIILAKLNESEIRARQYQRQISRMFKWSFA